MCPCLFLLSGIKPQKNYFGQGCRKLFDFGQAKPAAVGVATGVDQ